MSPKVTLLVEDHSRPITAFALVLPVGSLHDPDGSDGLAYLTGQMLMRGAGQFSQAELADELDYLGSGLSVSVGRETTTVTGDALTRNLDAFEALVGAILAEPRFEQAELDKLKRQTVAELEQVRDSDAAIGQRFFVRRMFDGHPYGRRLKGSRGSLEGIGLDDVKGFYGELYRHEGSLAGAAGDVDDARMKRYVERTVQRLPDGAAPAIPVPPSPRPGGVRVCLVDKPERSQTQVFMGHPTLAANDPDYLPLLVGQTLFGGTFTARLSHEIREKRGWSYGAYAYLNTDKHLGTFTMRFYPSVKDTVPAIRLADELYRELVEQGASEQDVATAKAYLVNSHPFSIDTPAKRLHERLMAFLQGRPSDWLDRLPERIEAVTTDQVNAAMARHLSPSDQIVTVVATAKDLEPELRAWERATDVEVADYRSED